MSNKSPQELRNILADFEIDLAKSKSAGESEEALNKAMQLLRSHMQTAFEYVIGDTDKIGADGLRASDGADMRYKVHEQRLRAAKWLGGIIEKLIRKKS